MINETMSDDEEVSSYVPLRYLFVLNAVICLKLSRKEGRNEGRKAGRKKGRRDGWKDGKKMLHDHMNSLLELDRWPDTDRF